MCPTAATIKKAMRLAKLSYNFAGFFPRDIKALSELKVLRINNNKLTGEPVVDAVCRKQCSRKRRLYTGMRTLLFLFSVPCSAASLSLQDLSRKMSQP